jgi:Ca-activated chloride channel family protein
MKGSRYSFIVHIALVALALPCVMLAAFQTGPKLVTTAVTVRDRTGQLVTNLTEHDFVVKEDGAPQTLARFTSDRSPLSVAVVIDTSQSLNGEPMKATRDAARKFIDALQPDDEVALVSFNHAVNIVANWTTDRTKLHAGLDGLAASGSTALYDALYRTMSLFTKRNLQRAAIVMISDGADSASDRTPAQLKKDLTGTDFFLYWIAMDDVNARPATRVSPSTLAELAAQGNGYSEVIHDTNDLDAALMRVSDELNHQYLMAYEPTTPANGTMHTVRVTVPNQNYVIRSRREVLR